jgi:hypothetical protein
MTMVVLGDWNHSSRGIEAIRPPMAPHSPGDWDAPARAQPCTGLLVVPSMHLQFKSSLRRLSLLLNEGRIKDDKKGDKNQDKKSCC